MWIAKYVCSVTINQRDSSSKYEFCQITQMLFKCISIPFLHKEKLQKVNFLRILWPVFLIMKVNGELSSSKITKNYNKSDHLT